MHSLRLLAILFVTLQALLFAGEPSEADEAYRLGLEKLQESQTDRSALVPATRLFTKAISLYEVEKNESKIVEVNSCLYWARKKFTLADTAAIKNDKVVEDRLNAVIREIPKDQAERMLESATNYAQSHADQPLLVAIRYFEVADRFKDTESGRSAMDLSLKAMQSVGEQAKRAAYKPAPTDGKVFIKSEPVGAQILLVTKDGGKLETGKVTPSLVQLPIGFQTVELVLNGFKSSLTTFEVTANVIAKPDAVKLQALTVAVDVLFEDGWRVYLNGSALKAGDGRPAETPCTIELPLGSHPVILAKDGFVDIPQRVDVKAISEKVSVEVKQAPVKGKSVTLGSSGSTSSASSVKPRTGARNPVAITVFAVIDDDADIYINGNQAMRCSFNTLNRGDVQLAAGDVIAIRVKDKGQEFGFAAVFKHKNGMALKTNTTDWRSYTPVDATKWWEISNDGGSVPVEASAPSTGRIREACKIDCQQIWPKGISGKDSTGYLYHVVNEKSFR